MSNGQKGEVMMVLWAVEFSAAFSRSTAHNERVQGLRWYFAETWLCIRIVFGGGSFFADAHF